MNPVTIAVQAILLGVPLAVLRAADAETTATAFAVTAIAIGVVLWLWDWISQVRAASAQPPPQWHKAGLRQIFLNSLAPVSFIALAVLPHALAGLPPLDDLALEGPDREFGLPMIVAGTSAFALIYVSSLIDAFYVLPHLSGQRSGRMPCESSLQPVWRRVTRVWLLHRLVATLGFVAALTAVVAIGANEFLSINQVVAAAIAAAATILAGFYLSRAPSIIALALSPSIQVGDKVELAEEFNGENGRLSSYYVCDFAFEGVKLRELDQNDEAVSKPILVRTFDRVLDVHDITRLVRRRSRFGPCTNGHCRQVNPYCRRLGG